MSHYANIVTTGIITEQYPLVHSQHYWSPKRQTIALKSHNSGKDIINEMKSQITICQYNMMGKWPFHPEKHKIESMYSKCAKYRSFISCLTSFSFHLLGKLSDPPTEYYLKHMHTPIFRIRVEMPPFQLFLWVEIKYAFLTWRYQVINIPCESCTYKKINTTINKGRECNYELHKCRSLLFSRKVV